MEPKTWFALLVAAALLAGCAESMPLSGGPGADDEDEPGDVDAGGDDEEPGETTESEDEGADDDATYAPGVTAADFTEGGSNPFFPLEPGMVWTYDETDEGESFTIRVEVLEATRQIQGVTATVVRDTVRDEDGDVVEDTYDWYAVDDDGNVWYLGEDTKEYEDGRVVTTAGSWEWGVDGALPGIIMKADPRPSEESYYQEHSIGHAVDRGQVLARGASVTVPYGTFTDTVTTREWSELEPGIVDKAYYARDVGLLKKERESGGGDYAEVLKTFDGAAGSGDGGPPQATAADFVTGSTNRWFPLEPGTVWTYEELDVDEEGEETLTIRVEVLAETRVVNGVTAIVVRDTVRDEDGEPVEDTYDWYAEDKEGNVWYLGEDSTEYEDGEPVGKAGSWEWGVDGALPGIIMKADPRPDGAAYYQEYYPGEAEDQAAVVAANEPVTVPFGTYMETLTIREWNPLEEASEELAYYAPGVGLLKKEKTQAEGHELLTSFRAP